jgi:hypothetical protein
MEVSMQKEFFKEIEGVKYRTLLFPWSSGMNVKSRLVKFLGPAIDTITTTGKDGGFHLDASKFTDRLSGQDVSSLIVEVLQYTYSEKERVSKEYLDNTFSGDYLNVYKLVLWVVEVNGFFGKGDILGILKKAVTVVPGMSPVSTSMQDSLTNSLNGSSGTQGK